MFVIDMLYQPDEDHKIGWTFSIVPIDEFHHDSIDYAHCVDKEDTESFEAWWHERFYYVSHVSEVAYFQVSDDIVFEFRMRWVGIPSQER